MIAGGERTNYRTCVGFVGGLAVALGVGAAVTVGTGCATAFAAPSDSSSSSGSAPDGAAQARTTDPDHGRGTPKEADDNRSADTHVSTDADDSATGNEPAQAGTTGAESDSTGISDSKPEAKASDTTDWADGDRSSHHGRPATAAITTTNSDTGADTDNTAGAKSTGDEATDEAASAPTTSGDTVPSTDTAPTAAQVRTVDDTPMPDAPAAAVTPGVEDATHVIPVASPPGLAPRPADPGSLPVDAMVAWTVAGVARREADDEVAATRSAIAVEKTSAAMLGATPSSDQQNLSQPIAVAPGIVVPTTLDGHYTLTAPPSLGDIITNFALGVLHQISNLIGIELSFVLSSFISSADPPFYATLGLETTKSTYSFTDDDGIIKSWKVWQISTAHPTDDVVVAVHGGALTIQPNLIQWLDYAQMARDTGATVIVPLYPLTQEGGNGATVVPPMAEFIAATVAEHGADHVSIYADSAGGDIAMLAVQKIARDCGGDAACLASARPARMVLISPALGGLFTDPNVPLIDDPVESVPEPGEFPEWQGDLPDTGPEALLWAPEQGSAADLPATTMYIGTRDILAPGAITFAARMVEEGSSVDVVIGMGQIHDWALGGLPTSSQAPVYRNAIYEQLGLITST